MNVNEAWIAYEAGRISRQELDRIVLGRSVSRTPQQQGQGLTWQRAKARLLLAEGRDTMDTLRQTNRAGVLTPKAARLMQAHIDRNAARAENLVRGGNDSAEAITDYREVR